MESFEDNEKLVYSVYNKKFGKYYHLKDDLLQIGRFALWKACLRFDATKGYKFSTYAVKAIINEMASLVYEELKHSLNTACDFADNLVGETDQLLEIRAIQDACSRCKYKDRLQKILQGYTISEIAEQENKTKQAISKTFVQDKKIIKRWLNVKENDI